MTYEQAIDCNKNLKEFMRITDKTSEYKFLEDNYIALDMAIQALDIWNKMFKSYEALTAKIESEDDISHATERIDKWCVEQLRNIISDYYADRIINELHTIKYNNDDETFEFVTSIDEMRECTPEENEAIDKYIKSISKSTGINIFDFYEDEEQEQIDFVQPKKKIPCTIKVQADGEYINKQQIMSDYADWYGYDYQNNWFYKHLKNMPSAIIQHELDEDCISRKAVLSILADHFDNPFDMVRKLPSVIIPNTTIQKSEQNNKKQDKEQYEKIDCEKTDCKNCINHNYCDYEQLPSITISQEHDGCKDCKYEDYPEYYYPCCDCKQNYVDKWERAKHWIHRNDDYNDWLECPSCGYGSEGEVKYGEGTPFCPYCGERLEEK